MLTHFPIDLVITPGLFQTNSELSGNFQHPFQELTITKTRTPVKYRSTLLRDLQQSALISIEFTSYEAGVIHVQFALKNHLQQYFGLLRGLLNLARPVDITLEVKRETKTFRLTVASHNEIASSEYFKTVLSMLRQEMRYKQVLTSVLEIETRIKKELRQLYALKF